MSWFAREFFEASPMLLMPVIGLVIFFSVFALITLRAMRMEKGDVEHAANLALGEDVHIEGASKREAGHG